MKELYDALVEAKESIKNTILRKEWEDGDIGQFDDYELSFEATIARIEGYGEYAQFSNEAAQIYRGIHLALKKHKEKESNK